MLHFFQIKRKTYSTPTVGFLGDSGSPIFGDFGNIITRNLVQQESLTVRYWQYLVEETVYQLLFMYYLATGQQGITSIMYEY